MPSENCYSYARNKPDSNLAPPGLVLKNLTCSKVIAAAMKDGMSKVPPGGKCPACTHKVYLLIETKGRDFHWYRQDADGTWSHKLSDYPADNEDGSGNRIRDPSTANSNYGDLNSELYNYTIKCGYLCTPN